jgi:hypothetical protein
MRRKVMLVVVLGLLIAGLSVPALAKRLPISGGPQPRPWAWGDPDWPAFCKPAGPESRRIMDNPVDTAPNGDRPIEGRHGVTARSRQGGFKAQSRRCEVKVLGVTIFNGR